jgi:hypothetical protein
MSNEVLKIGTTTRFHLDLGNLGAPTGTPQISIEKQGVVVLVATNMTVRAGTDNEIWYYDYTIPDIAVGQYESVFSYTVDGDAGVSISEFDITTYNIDDVKTDTETIIVTIGATSGDNSVTLNIKDNDSNNLEGVNFTIKNSNNDPGTTYGAGQTDSDGNTGLINIADGTYTVRLSKPGTLIGENKTIVVTTDATFNLTVTVNTITPPTSPGVCKVIVYPSKLGFTNVTDAKIYVTTLTNLSPVGGVFLDKRAVLMTYDSTTDLDSYYIEVIYGATIRLSSTTLGINHTLVVPSQTAYDVYGEGWE